MRPRLRVPYPALSAFLALFPVAAVAAPPLFRNPDVSPPAGPGEGLRLFDGSTLAGWTVLGNGSWTARDGAIHGRLGRADPQFSHLVHDTTVGDFDLAFAFRHARGNAGFFFRLERKDPSPAGVAGLQVVIDPGLGSPDAFGLYETNGRGWVRRWDFPGDRDLYLPGAWNTLRILAQGPSVQVELNGRPLVILPDDPGRLRGGLAFKLHGGQDVEIAFKDVVLAPAPSPTPLAAGADAGGPEEFRGRPGTWRLDGRFIGAAPAGPTPEALFPAPTPR